jgi:ATP-dependent protease HslVU (ClpYQ) peptidase subunit
MKLPSYTGNVHSWLFSILQSLATHPEFENIFIIINNDIYKCWNNMSYYLVTDVATLGSGQHIALGAYAALDHLALKERLRKSLAITADIDNGCGQPLYLLNGATYDYESL